jgi:anti-sigma regulatory factor (Ser/Thr protein kinase)
METVLTPLPPQTIHHVSESSGIAAVRRAGSQLASFLGLDETVAGKVALVITEAATNIFKHAGSGDILLRGLAAGDARGIEVLAIDKGPGFGNIEQAMRDGVSTVGSYGVGMGAMQRLADEFDLHADDTHGSALRMAVWSAGQSHREAEWIVGAVCLPLPSEEECGDAWSCACDDGQLLLMVADGLGHGPEAARASGAAVALVQPGGTFAPGAMLQLAHGALHGSRGAAVAVACLDGNADELRFAGIGNITVSLHGGANARHLVSHNGIVGSNMRKVQEFSMPLTDTAMLIMHSDGIGTRWDLGRYPGLSQRHPALIAAVLYRDHVRGRDDASIVVAQRQQGSGGRGRR